MARGAIGRNSRQRSNKQMSSDETKYRISLVALTQEQLVDILAKVGCASVSMESLNADIADGMPVNVDGTINLVNYAAWLLRENGE